MSIERSDAYRAEMFRTSEYNTEGRMEYILANLALNDLRDTTRRGVEPSQRVIEGVNYRLESAVDANRTDNTFLAYRSQLLQRFLQPIIWAEVINYDTLSNSQAKRVGEVLQLHAVNQALGELAITMLADYDTTRHAAGRQSARRLPHIVGALNEITPLMLINRHGTAKRFAVPSLAYEDAIESNAAKFDGIMYDQRPSLKRSRQQPYQVKSATHRRTTTHHSIDAPVPTIDQRLLGNLPKASQWPHDDRPFATVRSLIAEQHDSGEVGPTLDRLTSAVLKKLDEAA